MMPGMAGGFRRAAVLALSVVAFATVHLLVGEASAWAQKKYAVKIESEPTGAKVFVGDKESGSVGETPLDLKLPAGEHIIILEFPKHYGAFESITVKKKKRGKQEFSFTMEKIELATVRVTSPDYDKDIDGAAVFIDGDEIGEVPLEHELSPGPHQILIRKDGYKVLDNWIELTDGETTEVVAELELIAKKRAKSKGGGGGATAGGSMFEFGGGLGIGWRRFHFAGATTNNLRDFDANAIGTVHLSASVSPFKRGTMKRVSAVVSAILALPIEASSPMGTTISARWYELDFAARYRHPLNAAWTLVTDLGFHNTAFVYADTPVREEVPEISYKALRLSVGPAWQNELYQVGGGLEGQLVLDTGLLATRFRDTTTNAFGAGVHMVRRFGAARAEFVAAIRQYSLRFVSMPVDQYVAAGGSDVYIDLHAGISYQF